MPHPRLLVNSRFSPPTAPRSLKIPVSWDSPDPDRRDFDVQYSLDGSTCTDTLNYPGTEGETYTFRLTATDNVANTTQTEVAAQPDAAVTKYYHHGGSRVAMRQGAEVHYLHGDHLGSTSLTTNSAGAGVSEGRYLPFRCERTTFGERWTSGSAVTDFGFTGQRNAQNDDCGSTETLILSVNQHGIGARHLRLDD